MFNLIAITQHDTKNSIHCIKQEKYMKEIKIDKLDAITHR